MQLAIISGASRGIGLACARQFAAQGFTVINIARNPANQPGIIDLCCNLGWESELAETLEGLIPYASKAQQICLLHNASRFNSDQLGNCENDDLKLGFAVQIMAATMISRTVIPFMKPGSSLLYMGSTLSEKGVSNAYTYTLIKHAVAGMMRASCQDLSGSGIHTACICPGFTNTDMLQQRLQQSPQLAAAATDNAFSRLISPEEIAELVFWAHHHPVINGAMLHAHLGQNQQ